MTDELDDLKRQRFTLEERLHALEPRVTSPWAVNDADLFIRACRAVSDFLDKAGTEERTLALEALRIAIRATRTEATVHGVVPVDPNLYRHTNNHPHARREIGPTPGIDSKGCPRRPGRSVG